MEKDRRFYLGMILCIVKTLTNLHSLVIYPARCVLYLPPNDKGICTWGQNQFVGSLVSVFVLWTLRTPGFTWYDPSTRLVTLL